MNKNIILIVPILLISIFLAYRTESEEKIVNNILEEMYTYDYQEYKNIDGYEDVHKINTVKVKRLRNYFTDEFFDEIIRFDSMSRMLGVTQTYHCNSSIDSLEITIQDSENPDIITANYDIVIELEFLDEPTDTMYFDLSGSMTLYKKGINWEVNYITSNHRFYQRLGSLLREK